MTDADNQTLIDPPPPPDLTVVEEPDWTEETLPFSSLEDADVRISCGCPPDRWIRGAPLPGNFIAGNLMQELRTSPEVRRYKHRNRNLSMVLELPEELILEIFEYLHPIDLFHLIQTSRGLRNLLLGRHMNLLWSNVFNWDDPPSLPRRPEDVSYPRWASLLFGQPICDDCGVTCAMVNFFRCKRLCNSCIIHGEDALTLDGTRDVLIDHPEHSNLLTDIVRHYECAASIVYPTNEWGITWIYLKPEVDAAAEEVRSHLASIERGDPGAVEKFEAFQSDRALEVSNHTSYARDCNEWGDRLTKMIGTKNRIAITHFALKSVPRLLGLGYSKEEINEDLVESVLDSSACHALRYNRRTFERHLPSIEREVLRRKKIARDALVNRREHAVKHLLSRYRADNSQVESARHIPQNRTVYQYGVFFTFINDASATYESLSEDIANPAFDLLTVEWREECKRRLILTSLDLDYLETVPLPNSVLLTRENLCRMELATSVFTCPACEGVSLSPKSAKLGSALFGLADARLHMHCFYKDYEDCNEPLTFPSSAPAIVNNYGFSLKGYSAVCSLLDLLDLDRHMTLRRDLDRLDARFICLNCFDDRIAGVKDASIKAFFWQECVLHEIESHHDYACEWGLLSPEAAKSVKLCEDYYPLSDESVWYCKHCFKYSQYHRVHDEVVSHLKKIHNVIMPTLQVDIGFIDELRSDSRTPYTVEPSPTYRCLRCSGYRRYELWSWDALVEKHFTKDHAGVELTDDDWEKIPLIERVSSYVG